MNNLLPLSLHQNLVGTLVDIPTHTFRILFDLWQHWATLTTSSMKQLSWLLRVLLYSVFPPPSLTLPLNIHHLLFHLCLLTKFLYSL